MGKKFRDSLYIFIADVGKIEHLCNPSQRGVRVVEGARLESVYTPKGYRGFESLPLCQILRQKGFIFNRYYLYRSVNLLLPVFFSVRHLTHEAFI